MYKKAFTIIEIVLVIVLIGILITITFIYINPQKQISNVRDAKRQADLLSIYIAIEKYRNNNGGVLPEGISTSKSVDICQKGCEEDSDQIDISTELSTYLRFESLPIDPLQTSNEITGYTVFVDPQGKVTVSAPLTENKPDITISE